MSGVDINAAIGLASELAKIGLAVLSRDAKRRGETVANMTPADLLRRARELNAADPETLVAEGEASAGGN